MDEKTWWDRYVATLYTLPLTKDNPFQMFGLLEAVGFTKPRTGMDRPDTMSPERAALAAYRLRFELPEDARRAIRESLAEHDERDPLC